MRGSADGSDATLDLPDPSSQTCGSTDGSVIA
jgi:hypothetical protein